VTFLQSTRDVGHDRHAEPTKGDRQDRETRQPIGVEIAEHLDELPLVSRLLEPPHDDVGIREGGRVVEAGHRVAEPRPNVRR
jgi:hypothetical protein